MCLQSITGAEIAGCMPLLSRHRVGERDRPQPLSYSATHQFCTAAQTKSDLQVNGSQGSVQTINADPHIRIKASLMLGSNRGAERTQLPTEEYASHLPTSN